VPTWLIVLLFLAVLVACVGYLTWAVSMLLVAVLRRRELQRLDAGVLERLTTPGADEVRLSDLRRLHGIADSRLRRLRGEAPSLRSSLESAMYQRTTQPEAVRRQLGGRRLPSVASITRLMDLLDSERPYIESTQESVDVGATRRPRARPDGGAPSDGGLKGGAAGDAVHLSSEQRAHIGAALIGIAGLCVVSTVGGAAGHSFKLSSPAAIALLAFGVVSFLGVLWAFGLIGRAMMLVGAVGFISAGLVARLIVNADSTRAQVHRDAELAHLSGPYFVGGTCADLACGLRQHVAPSVTSSHAGAPLLPDGTRVYIRCQMIGGVVRLHKRVHESNESNIWDLLTDGRYVSDLFVNTSKLGELDSSLPRCQEK
jgi:hypothetical protein